ncbi:hypothetical protein [Perlabentimonas gracilis]|uniref:hypothetical protein n=1 Tax=Perlabentimonas gracilis TaxID=2715279 RepID=UPI00140D9A1F|nr:hypothetical protein [Perlabentimonas gracilis]NHB69903.1 hypothetical protein [Perlabentimonas gracilis]
MKKIVLLSLLLISVQISYSQINAITERGDEVILYNDGTWKYLHEDTVESSQVHINEKKFFKDEKSSFLVKSSKVNVGLWIDPKAWTFTKGTENDAHEYLYQKRGEDLYAMFISERVRIPVETLKGIAVQNAKGVSPDIRVIREEFRNVNGVKVFMMQMSGTIQGMRFVYYGYYYSNSSGTIQLITYTGENLFEGYFDDIETFLNGLVEL